MIEFTSSTSHRTAIYFSPGSPARATVQRECYLPRWGDRRCLTMGSCNRSYPYMRNKNRKRSANVTQVYKKNFVVRLLSPRDILLLTPSFPPSNARAFVWTSLHPVIYRSRHHTGKNLHRDCSRRANSPS